MPVKNFDIKGLTSEEVLRAREAHGKNTLEGKKAHGLLDALKSLVKEPMVILLLVASTIYFISGSVGDGIFMAAAIVLVSAISLYQDGKSQNALERLKDFTRPKCKVIRNAEVVEINSEEVVLGDSLMVEEGATIAADGEIVHSNDFSVNESILTGESLPAYKDSTKEDRTIYKGTTVASGLAIATVTAIGNATQLGKIGKSLEDIQEEKTPLERQINAFVKKMVVAGAFVFVIVWGINFYNSRDVLDSLLKALTLAMSILPEEIPVAFTTFMALGSYRLMKMGIVVKQIKAVETLGSATVICSDKTGTITENKMALTKVYSLSSNKIVDIKNPLGKSEKELVRSAMWASEPIPFDPMEVALHDAYEKITQKDERPDYQMVHEYPLGGEPPMMTHLFENTIGQRIIAAKGAPEALMAVSNLSDDEINKIEEAIDLLATDGYRVLGVGTTHFKGTDYPKNQQDFNFVFMGIIAFYDPPKKNIQSVFNSFHDAGIKVKIVTGDNAATTDAIAREIGFRGCEKSISGDELMPLTQTELSQRVQTTNLFTRMFPKAKLKIINALKANREIVAMIGDGVNDAPALKAAHIGIAMGKKGTEIAKEAALLVLLKDDLGDMVVAVAMGRRIYTNLKKAIQYIISIHIPIILTVFIPLVLWWPFPNIFSPVHVIFFELIMGPTCSIIYENEPMEKDIMTRPPRPISATFFNWRELATSVFQGLLITAGTLSAYQYAVLQGSDEATTRTVVFITLITANIALTLVNRSFKYSILTTIKYKNNLVPLIIAITVALTGLLLFIPPLTHFFELKTLDVHQILVATGIGFFSVIWYEVVKWRKRVRERNEKFCARLI
ncbi:cation-translocating P-type ATPase [Flavobacteriaceae bacterium F89]|uniref:Cation-translocating P-type ATPase n=1 Tax=Cerina litoralis TaxID=2874477 RepID=A0AAE3JRV6_9FLAO|nr:cation-translocating P-type ATPase [Cerina litoralis]MCG2460022.1 cation-translocating P-type ATPase [Cerina litoralis]